MDIRTYLPLYLGCEVLATRDNPILKEQAIYKGDVRKLTAPFLFDAMYAASAFRLLLRPLSDMTVEEKDDLKNLKYDIEQLAADRGAAEITLWHLSKQFDVYDLIEDGLALDKTKFEVST